MDSHERIPAPLIAAHAGSLRTLVLALARDRHEADEIEQETWLRALTAPPTSFERFGGWLATVARGFASKRRRSQRRRETHEHAYAAGRELAGSVDASRADTLRAVVEALLALDEPYRSTVWQRYFEGLAPREIAARANTPLATVESRLNRAHAKLRADLERRLGARNHGAKRALLALIGFEPAWRTAFCGAWTGAWIVGLKSKIVVVAAALLVAWWSWQRSDSAAPAAARTDAESALAAADSANGPIAPPTPADPEQRTAVQTTPQPTLAASATAANGPAPYEFELDVAPLDEHQRPLAAADVFLAPVGRRFARLGTTDWTGHLTIAWRAHAPRFEGLLFAKRDGFGATPIRRVQLLAGERHAFVLAMAPDSRRETSVPLIGLVLRSSSDAGTFHLTTAPAELNATDWEFDEHRNASMYDEWITPTPPWPQARAFEAAVDSAGVPMLGDLEFAISVEGVGLAYAFEPGTPLPVEVFVFDVDGAPVPNALVSIAASNSFRGDSTTDAEGRVLNHVWTSGDEPVELMITAGGLELPLASTRIVAKPGEPVTCRLTLFAERALDGRLVTTDDGALAKWTLELLDGRTQDCVGLATTDEHGSFRFGGAPIAPLDLIARDPESGTRFVALAGILPSELDAALVARIDPRPARVRFELVDGAGVPIPDAEVRALATYGALGDHGARGVRVELPEGDARAVWQTSALAPGEYELEVGAKSRGSRVLGRYRLEPGETLDLGALRWAAPEFTLRARDDASTVLAGRYSTLDQGVGVSSRDFLGALPFPVPLGDGAWRLEARVAPLAEADSLENDTSPRNRRSLTFEPSRARELVIAPSATESSEDTATKGTDTGGANTEGSKAGEATTGGAPLREQR